jgi:hypothetical protein
LGVTDAPVDILVVEGGGFIGAAFTKCAVEFGWKVDSLGLSMPSDQNKQAGVNYKVADIAIARGTKFLLTKQ